MNAKERYRQKTEVVKSIWLHRENDKDILEWLETKPSKSAYVKELIRADMKKSK